MRTVGRQEHAVEREALWRITKLRVEAGHVIDVGEALAVEVAGSGDKNRKSGSASWWDSCFLSM